MKKGVCLLLCAVVFYGCAVRDMPSLDVRGKAVGLRFGDIRSDFRNGRFFLYGSGISLDDMSRELVRYGVRLAYDDDLASKSVSMDLDGEYSIMELMRVLEVKYHCVASKSGSLWILRSGSDDGKSDVVTHGSALRDGASGGSVSGDGGGYLYYAVVPGLSHQEVIERFSDYGLKMLGNGVYYCRNSIAKVIQLDELLVGLMACLPVQYYFKVYFISDDILREFGLNMTPSLKGSYSKSWGRSVSVPVDYSAAVSLLMDSSFELSDRAGYRCMGGVVREGAEFVFRIGDDVPMAKRAVSDAGTVTDTGYEYQRFGFSVKVRVEGRSLGVCTVEIDNTDIGGYVGGYPTKHGSNISTVLQVAGNDRMYVGSCLMDSEVKGFFSFRKQRQLYHVWLSCDLLDAGRFVSGDF